MLLLIESYLLNNLLSLLIQFLNLYIVFVNVIYFPSYCFIVFDLPPISVICQFFTPFIKFSVMIMQQLNSIIDLINGDFVVYGISHNLTITSLETELLI
jgi:hypothetical protein